MITYEHYGAKLNKDGHQFFIVAKDYDAICDDLRAYAKQHPEKWIYTYCDHQCKPNKKDHRPEMVMEVSTYDERPAGLMMFYSLYQEGCEHREAKVTPEMRSKQMAFFAMLGSMYNKS